MFRESTDPTSANVFLAADANGAILMQTRSASGANTTAVWGPPWSATSGIWLKLERSGNTFTGSTSPDRVTWTALPSPTLTLANSTAPILAGLAVTAENYGSAALATAIFDNVNVTGSTQTVPITITSVPSGLSVVVDAVNIVQNPPPNTRYVSPTWSDGGAPVHTITAPAQGATYTATFITQYLVILKVIRSVESLS